MAKRRPVDDIRPADPSTPHSNVTAEIMAAHSAAGPALTSNPRISPVMPSDIDTAASQIVGHIIATEQALALESRQAVQQHYKRRLTELKLALADLDPNHPMLPRPPDPVPEPTEPADIVRRDLGRFIGIWENKENAPHIRGIALINIAEVQAELHRLTGSEITITVVAANAHYNEMIAAERQLKISPAPPMGHAHVTDRKGQWTRRTAARTTELVSDPVAEQVQARRGRAMAAAAQAQYRPTFAGKTADQLIPNPTASPAGFNISSNAPVRTSRTHASGRTS
jgi:hypothetical protein